ncbi:MAG: VCBS domain-containing protein, partial [Pseudomonadota bacterium]
MAVVYVDSATAGDPDGSGLSGRRLDYTKVYEVVGPAAAPVVGTELDEIFVNRTDVGAHFIGAGGDDLIGDDGDLGGDDQLDDGSGDDTLEGGAGVDTMFGRNGDDVFIIRAGDDAAGEKYDGGGDEDEIVVIDGALVDLRDDQLQGIERLRFAEEAGGADVAQVTLSVDQARGLTVIGGAGDAGARQSVILDAAGADVGTSFGVEDLPTFESFDTDGKHLVAIEFGDEANVVERLGLDARIDAGGGDDVVDVGYDAGDVFAGAGSDVVTVAGRLDLSRAASTFDGGSDAFGGVDRLLFDSAASETFEQDGETLALIDLRGAALSGFEIWAFAGDVDAEARVDALAPFATSTPLTLVGRDGATDRLVIDFSTVNEAGGDPLTASPTFELQTFGDENDAIVYVGGAGDTTILGSAFDETLRSGNGGADSLAGGGGKDVLIVETGASSTLTGDFVPGDGDAFADVFRVLPGAQSVTIRDFAVGVDMLDLFAFDFALAEAAVASARSVASPSDPASEAVELTVDGIEVRLEGVSLDAFSDADVLRRDAPEIVGDLAALTTDASPIASGLVAVEAGDGSAPGPNFAPTTIEDARGTFQLADSGEWSFEGAGDVLAALNQGESEVVSFAVADADGIASATVAITVVGANQAPTTQGELTVTTLATAPVEAEVSALGADPDAEDDGATLDYVVVGDPGIAVTKTGRATFEFDPTATAEALSLGETRIEEVRFAAVDSRGAASAEPQTGDPAGLVRIEIVGVNEAPTLTQGDVVQIAEDAEVAGVVDLAVAGDDGDGDDDGASLTYEIVTASPLLDASIAGAELVFAPSAAAQTLRAGQTERADVTVRATDRHGASAQAVFAIDVIGANDAPTPLDDFVSGGEDAPFALGGPLLNDGDVDVGDPAVLVSIAGQTVVAGAVIPIPQGGLVRVGEDGVTRYDPDGAFEALDEGETAEIFFNYLMSDGQATRGARVNVQIVGASEETVTGSRTSDKLVGDTGANTL